MKDNEMFKEYYAKYKIDDINCNNISKYIFVLESPHNDEVDKDTRYPVAGQSGKDMAKFIGISSGSISLGYYCKNNPEKGISIINASSAPLQEVNILEEEYKELIKKVNNLVRNGYKNYGNHTDEEINIIEKFILSDFEERLKNLNINNETKIIVCGKFAKSYFEKIKLKNINNDNILYVPHPARSQWSDTFENLNKLKQFKF